MRAARTALLGVLVAACAAAMPSAVAAAGPVHPGAGPGHVDPSSLAGKVAHAPTSVGAPVTDHPRLAYSLRDDAGLSTAGRTTRAQRDAHGRVVVVAQTRAPGAVQRDVVAAGGRVLVTAPGLVKAAVPAARLAAFATSSGVDVVREPIAFRPAAVDSQGVGETGATAWHTATTPRLGAGQRIAVVDGGFTGYVAAEGTELPAAADVTPINTYCDPAAAGAEHGTAVAEIVHDMAPAAKLVLICIKDDVDFAAVSHRLATDATLTDVKIANLSGGFPISGRGDGSGAAGSPAAAVKESRQAGVLWTVSAGNEGLLHYSFTYRDTDKDNIADVRTSCWLRDSGVCSRKSGLDDYEYVPVLVAANSVGEFTLQWDAWPTTTQDFNFYAYTTEFQFVAQSVTNQHAAAGPPVEDLTIDNTASANDNVFVLAVRRSAATIAPRMDIFGFGDVGFLDQDGFTTPGSITEPATSPYVLAVGAHLWSDGSAEDYSGVGPTIDGRVKPDISGPDGTATPVCLDGQLCGTTHAFYGTSAAAPHAAGAAALIRAANPGLDAAQLQEVLQARAAAAGAAGTDDVFGTGLLRLGAVDTPTTPAPSAFTALPTPLRVLDTRTTIGGHHSAFGPNATFALPVAGTGSSAGVPADAKAVVLNLTVASPTGGGYLAAYPTGSTAVVSNLNFVAGDLRSNNATVTVGADRKVVLKNASSGSTQVIVDVVGYYGGTSASSYGYQPLTPVRKLDTRAATGGHQRVFGSRETYDLLVTGGTVPADATAVALTLTAVSPTTAGWLSVYPTGGAVPATSSLNFKAGQVVPNLVVSKVGTGGKVAIRSGATGTLNVVVDVVGYYSPTAPGGFVALREPMRVLDSRSGTSRLGVLGAGGSLHLTLGNLWGVPHTATGAVINTTVAAPTTSSFLTVWPTGAARPNASNLNFVAQQIVANNVMTGLGSGGQVDVYNRFGSTQVIGDLAGYFAPLLP